MIASVSGGSIAAGILATQAGRIRNDVQGTRSACFESLVAQPAIELAQSTIDWKAATLALVTPESPGNLLAVFYDRMLFDGVKLRDLPDRPYFIFQATNLHTGSVFSFTKRSIGDAQIGSTPPADQTLASAVAASSSFPPVLSRFVIKGGSLEWTDWQRDIETTWSREYRDRIGSSPSGSPTASIPTPLRSRLRSQGLLLTDGGVADKMAIEGVWHTNDTLLISDGGSEARAAENPPTNWIGQLAHVTELIHTQPTSLRHHLVLDGFRTAAMSGRDGAYWSLAKPLPRHRQDECYDYAARIDDTVRQQISEIPTRLTAMSELEAKKLVNAGYNITDWSLPYLNARMAKKGHGISRSLPYPDAPLWPSGEMPPDPCPTDPRARGR